MKQRRGEIYQAYLNRFLTIGQPLVGKVSCETMIKTFTNGLHGEIKVTARELFVSHTMAAETGTEVTSLSMVSENLRNMLMVGMESEFENSEELGDSEELEFGGSEELGDSEELDFLGSEELVDFDGHSGNWRG